MSAGEFNLAQFDGLRRTGFITGAAGLLVSLIELILHPQSFFHSYLLAFIFWLAFPLGSLAVLMLHHLTGGGWGYLIRRPLEAATRTLWLLAILYIPLLLGMRYLYLWTQPGAATNPIVTPRHFYLNVPFFLLRSAIYFAVWFWLSRTLNRWSLQQDEASDPSLSARLAGISGPGLALYGVTISFASIDWVMSLEPDWFSSIYGMVFIVAQSLVAMAFVILIARRLAERDPIATVATPVRFNDLGNLLLTMVMLWAYFSFSQFLIIWSGNLPEEISWYMSRARGGWAALALVLIIFHFAVPFFLLLSRGVKRHGALSFVAWLLIVLSLFDMIWLIEPSFDFSGPRLHWTDFTLLIGMGGIWLWSFFGELRSRALLPQHDPRLAEVLEHAAEH
jgi:hypothetical protein